MRSKAEAAQKARERARDEARRDQERLERLGAKALRWAARGEFERLNGLLSSERSERSRGGGSRWLEGARLDLALAAALESGAPQMAKCAKLLAALGGKAKPGSWEEATRSAAAVLDLAALRMLGEAGAIWTEAPAREAAKHWGEGAKAAGPALAWLASVGAPLGAQGQAALAQFERSMLDAAAESGQATGRSRSI